MLGSPTPHRVPDLAESATRRRAPEVCFSTVTRISARSDNLRRRRQAPGSIVAYRTAPSAVEHPLPPSLSQLAMASGPYRTSSRESRYAQPEAPSGEDSQTHHHCTVDERESGKHDSRQD